MQLLRVSLIVALIGLAGFYMVRVGIRSATEIVEANDFEVFYYVGEAAAARDAGIYEIISPVKKLGPFLYPPSAAVLFAPLSWLSHDGSGVIFSIAKSICLAVLLWGAVWFSGWRPVDF